MDFDILDNWLLVSGVQRMMLTALGGVIIVVAIIGVGAVFGYALTLGE